MTTHVETDSLMAEGIEAPSPQRLSLPERWSLFVHADVSRLGLVEPGAQAHPAQLPDIGRREGLALGRTDRGSQGDDAGAGPDHDRGGVGRVARRRSRGPRPQSLR